MCNGKKLLEKHFPFVVYFTKIFIEVFKINFYQILVKDHRATIMITMPVVMLNPEIEHLLLRKFTTTVARRILFETPARICSKSVDVAFVKHQKRA